MGKAKSQRYQDDPKPPRLHVLKTWVLEMLVLRSFHGTGFGEVAAQNPKSQTLNPWVVAPYGEARTPMDDRFVAEEPRGPTTELYK